MGGPFLTRPPRNAQRGPRACGQQAPTTWSNTTSRAGSFIWWMFVSMDSPDAASTPTGKPGSETLAPRCLYPRHVTPDEMLEQELKH